MLGKVFQGSQLSFCIPGKSREGVKYWFPLLMLRLKRVQDWVSVCRESLYKVSKRMSIVEFKAQQGSKLNSRQTEKISTWFQKWILTVKVKAKQGLKLSLGSLRKASQESKNGSCLSRLRLDRIQNWISNIPRKSWIGFTDILDVKINAWLG